MAEIKLMNAYWMMRNILYGVAAIFNEERLSFQLTGVTLPKWKSKQEGPGAGGWASSGLMFSPGFSMMSVDYDWVISNGLNKIIEEAEKAIKNVTFWSRGGATRAYFLQSAIINLKAIIRFASRFAVLAEDMAAKEKDPVRKKELERIAEICRWVPANPARCFHEAIQFFWFIYLMIAQMTTPYGRFDQYMYPYYKKDIEEGKITDEEVLELLQCLRIKDMQIYDTGVKDQRSRWSGMARWHNAVIGGVTPEGKDATNELTYLMLEAVKRCPTPHHTVTLRVHEGTPEDLMVKALEVVKMGVGMPAFVGDKSYIEYECSKGVPLNEARDYYLMGCLDATIPTSDCMLYQLFVTPLVFDFFMHNGVEPRTGRQVGPKTGDLESFKSFDDLMAAWKEQLAYFLTMEADYMNMMLSLGQESMPGSLSSVLRHDGVKEGDTYYRTYPYNNRGALCPVGMITVADSLAAIKKLIFDEKKVTMKELKAALDANWQGNGYDEIRKMCLAAPKYGNDDDYVDLIAKELYQWWDDICGSLDYFLGGKFSSAGVSIGAHQPGGELTNATPDGRYAGEILADGTTSPVQGRDTHGPTAVIKSAAKIDQVPWRSLLMNMKFHPSTLKSTEDLSKLSNLIKTYFALGGKHVQFNVVNRETLLDAQKQPEKHRDLVVRVAGYSAYFVQLNKAVQDEIIARMEHEKSA
jgi:pyruvate formate-lyase/glycerol dehydratase family glycyl radical enzyme